MLRHGQTLRQSCNDHRQLGVLSLDVTWQCGRVAIDVRPDWSQHRRKGEDDSAGVKSARKLWRKGHICGEFLAAMPAAPLGPSGFNTYELQDLRRPRDLE
jgi:hypothetical protein